MGERAHHRRNSTAKLRKYLESSLFLVTLHKNNVLDYAT